VRVTGPYAPLLGIAIGALGGAIYWLAVQFWPSSVAVILSIAATALLTTEFRGLPATRLDLLGRVLCVLVKYNALMALSAAKLPFASPANLPLALIMIAGYAASFALLVSVMATRAREPAATARQSAPTARQSAPKIGHGALSLALLIGFAPAALLGIPGLIGLASAIVVGLGFIAFFKYKKIVVSDEELDATQLVTEACFYLGALATWKYV
jgi:adenosylcobinamide-GDP ribazoletransferase